MDSKTFLAALAGGVVNFLLGYAIFAIALGDFYASHMKDGVSREQPDLVAIALGGLVFSLLLAYIYQKWAGIKTIAGGAKAGAIIGGLAGLAFALWRFGGTHALDGYLAVVVDGLAISLLSAFTGAAVGWVLGRGATS